MVSSHDFVKDKRNKNIKIYINGKFYKKKKTEIHVFFELEIHIFLELEIHILF